MSRVELARRARRDIIELDWPLSDAVAEALGLLPESPGRSFSPDTTGGWRLKQLVAGAEDVGGGRGGGAEAGGPLAGRG